LKIFVWTIKSINRLLMFIGGRTQWHGCLATCKHLSAWPPGTWSHLEPGTWDLEPGLTTDTWPAWPSRLWLPGTWRPGTAKHPAWHLAWHLTTLCWHLTPGHLTLTCACAWDLGPGMEPGPDTWHLTPRRQAGYVPDTQHHLAAWPPDPQPHNLWRTAQSLQRTAHYISVGKSHNGVGLLVWGLVLLTRTPYVRKCSSASVLCYLHIFFHGEEILIHHGRFYKTF
jgi:hypothetical protein